MNKKKNHLLTIISNNKIRFFFSLLIISIILISTLLLPENFKSKKILEAFLDDDRSAVHLILRDNDEFEVISSGMFDETTYSGKFELLENKIIFKNRHFDNKFIPDTLTIIGDTIYFRFDEKGKPIAEYSNYFNVKFNNLTKKYSKKTPIE
jgi:hypothetical protein